jgi:hypothetical protein
MKHAKRSRKVDTQGPSSESSSNSSKISCREPDSRRLSQRSAHHRRRYVWKFPRRLAKSRASFPNRRRCMRSRNGGGEARPELRFKHVSASSDRACCAVVHLVEQVRTCFHFHELHRCVDARVGEELFAVVFRKIDQRVRIVASRPDEIVDEGGTSSACVSISLLMRVRAACSQGRRPLQRTPSHATTRSCAKRSVRRESECGADRRRRIRLRASPWRSVVELVQVVALTESLPTATRRMALAA